MKNNKKGFAILPVIIAVIVILAAGGGYWYVQKTRPAQQPANSATATSSPAAQTLNWKTYSDPLISFKYPQDLSFQALHTSFVDLVSGLEADIPSSYSLPNSLQRTQKIYIGVNGARTEAECMQTQPSTSQSQYAIFISPVTTATGRVFNKYQSAKDCAMDGCAIGNTYTMWNVDRCYEVSWFAIQSSISKIYSGLNDPRAVAALSDAQATTQKLMLFTEQILSTFNFEP